MINMYFYKSVSEIEIDNAFSMLFYCEKECDRKEMIRTVNKILDYPCIDFTSIGKYCEEWHSLFDEVLVKNNIEKDEDRLVCTVSFSSICKEAVEEWYLICFTDCLCVVCEDDSKKAEIMSYIEEISGC